MTLPTHFVVPANVAALADLAQTGPGLYPRFALGCVRFTIAEDGTYTVLATDARILGLLTGDSDPARDNDTLMGPKTDDRPSEPAALLPADHLRDVTRRSRKRSSAQLRLRLAALGESCAITATNGGGKGRTHYVPAEEGKMPEAGPVTPKGPPAASLTVNPRRLAQLLTVAADLQLPNPEPKVTLEIHLGTLARFVVRCKGDGNGQDFLGICMPMETPPPPPTPREPAATEGVAS